MVGNNDAISRLSEEQQQAGMVTFLCSWRSQRPLYYRVISRARRASLSTLRRTVSPCGQLQQLPLAPKPLLHGLLLLHSLLFSLSFSHALRDRGDKAPPVAVAKHLALPLTQLALLHVDERFAKHLILGPKVVAVLDNVRGHV